MIKISLIRRHYASPEAYTAIHIDGSHRLKLPRGPWSERHDDVMEQLRAVIEAKWLAVDHDPAIRAEILAPYPAGEGVCHGDVIGVLDALTAAGITRVSFEGALTPLAAALRRK